ncbi:MAG: DUF4861 family protein [bacterium]
MKNYIILFVVLVVIATNVHAQNEKSFNIELKNPTELTLTDYLVEANFETLKKQYPTLTETNFEVLLCEEKQAFQIIKTEKEYSLCFTVNFTPNEEKSVKFIYEKENPVQIFKQRTYAELSMKPGNIYYDKRFRGDEFKKVNKIKVPSIHTDHDALFKYEGPGWESEKVGYRFYLDWRNSTDIYGKKINELLLENVGTHDTVAKDDSYHSMQEWGMDIFKVGNTFGIGSFGMWDQNKVNMVSKTDSVYCEIPYTGPVKAEIKTDYYGWQVNDKKYNLESKISISAGSRLTQVNLSINNNAGNIVTGLAKHNNTEVFKSKTDGNWKYLALYGKQTLVDENDKLGIAVIYNTKEFVEEIEDSLSYVIKLKPENGNVKYYFCAAWEQEKDGIKTLQEFINYLDETVKLLENPIIIKFN